MGEDLMELGTFLGPVLALACKHIYGHLGVGHLQVLAAYVVVVG